MPHRNIEFCLPSSLQVCFERLFNGPPISLEERMSYEWLLLQSLNAFPTSAWEISLWMVESGFYYTGQGTCTRCYIYNAEHEGWNNTDNLHAIHRQISSPNCPFLGGNPTYPNFPIIPDTVHNGNNIERSGSIATQSIPVLSEKTQSMIPEPYPQPIITSSIIPSSTLYLDKISVSPSASTNGCHQVYSETAQVEVRWENTEPRLKQQQTSRSPSTETSWPESSPRSTNLRHHQQPRIDAENTEYMNQGNSLLVLPACQEEDPHISGNGRTPRTP
ncbi:hypothetical protein CHS0354_004535 [Potamilus streckersoni]|uniref:Uncharacterized protein n=1 Tax=Potamilus streckersoni TaxID=2493646 RepID=A0AAE0S5A6_9BIVA|nr:hypothetical protein CHS0354_004535 [Potamilus streckersoni]